MITFAAADLGVTWQLVLGGLAGLAVAQAANFAWQRFTQHATWALVVAAWEDLADIRRQLAAAETALKAARLDAATDKAFMVKAWDDLRVRGAQLDDADTKLKAARLDAAACKALADDLAVSRRATAP